MLWSQGYIDNQEYIDNKKSVIISKDPEFDKAVLESVNEIGPTKYNVGAYKCTPPHAIGARNCQTWTDDILERANNKMLSKRHTNSCKETK